MSDLLKWLYRGVRGHLASFGPFVVLFAAMLVLAPFVVNMQPTLREPPAFEAVLAAHTKAEKLCAEEEGAMAAKCVALEKRELLREGREQMDLKAQLGMTDWAEKMTKLTLLGLMASAVTVVLVLGSFKESQRATEEARNANAIAKEGMRPWLALDFEVEDVGIQDGAVKIKGTARSRNIGHSPATSVTFGNGVVAGDEACSQLLDRDPQLFDATGRRAIMPGEYLEWPFEAGSSGREELKDSSEDPQQRVFKTVAIVTVAYKSDYVPGKTLHTSRAWSIHWRRNGTRLDGLPFPGDYTIRAQDLSLGVQSYSIAT